MSIADRSTPLFGAFTMSTMTTATHGFDEPQDARPVAPANDPAGELRTQTAAVRVSFTWFGTRKSVEKDQKQTMADSFEAEGDFLSAGKKLLNTKHPAYRAVTKVRGRILEDWRDSSLPFPEPGIRLIRQDGIERFNARMESYRDELDSAVYDLNRHFDEIREEARRRLGTLYNPADYPSSLTGLFAVTWDFPSVEPPSYLMELAPGVYAQERARVASQFDEAVRLAEEAFTAQFADAVTRLCERLGRDDDGNPKVFRDSAISNLTDFFERFRSLNVRSNPELDALVDRARDAVQGASPARLRQSTDFRENVARSLADVGQTLGTMMVNRPRRNILRGNGPQEAGDR